MREKLRPREDARSEMLLDLARYWRICGAQSNDPWRCDMMRATAEEFECAAANVIRQTLMPSQKTSIASSQVRVNSTGRTPPL